MKEKSIFIDIPLKVGFDTIILSQSTKERSSLNRIEEKSEKSRFFVVLLFCLFCFFFVTLSRPEVKMQN